MFILKYFTLFFVISAYVHCDDVNNKLDEDSTTSKPNEGDSNLITDKASVTTSKEVERVDVYVYYEALCPFCIQFFIEELEPVVTSMHEYLGIHLYPYGNAVTEVKDGKIVITCQHGESECYGNKLHGCAIDILKNDTKSALYNSCMMDEGSDDNGATECGKSMKIDADPIKTCAKGDKGIQLLKYYGDLSNEIYYPGVPYILVKDVTSSADEFKKDVCDAFTNPPPACNDIDSIRPQKDADVLKIIDYILNH